MAVYFGEIVPPVSPPSSVTVTGLPFEPVAVIFFGTRAPGTLINQMFGCASGSGDEWAMWVHVGQETHTYTERFRDLRDDCCIVLYDITATTIQAKGAMSSLNSDGFTVAFTGTGTTQPVFYMAIGGKNISAAHAGTFYAGGSGGIFSVTDPGFQPKALIVGQQISLTLNSRTAAMCWGLGFAAGNNQHSTFVHATSGSAVTGDHMQRNNAVVCAALGASLYVAELDSFTANGFDLNVTDAFDNLQHGYLAIDCATAVVGTSEFPDSTGVVSYPTPGLEPAGVLFSWNGADAPASSGSTTMPVRPGVGGMDGVVSFPKPGEGSVMGLHRASAPFGSYQPLQTWVDDASLVIRGAGSQVDPDATTLFSQGEFDAFAMGSFDLDWTTATANSREFGWLALPGDLEVNWIPQIYRRQT